MTNPCFLIAGGGTGGHIFPAVAMGEALAQQVPDARVLFVGTRYGMEKTLIPKLGHRLLTLPMRGLLGKSVAQKLDLMWRIPASMLLSLWLLVRYRPRVVIGVGGYASAPLLFVAALLRFPTMIQEQNAFPGLSNRLLGRFVKLACSGFAETAARLPCPTIAFGNPVRADFLQRAQQCRSQRPRGRKLLILGGSQGARALNRDLPPLLLKALPPEQGWHVVHQCGRDREAEVRAAYGSDLPFQLDVQAFIENVADLMGQSRLVICRAGASTVAELRLMRVPALLVPFPAATHDHQTFNAKSLADSGAAMLIPEQQLSQAGSTLAALLGDEAQLDAMAAAYPAQTPDSAALCARAALQLAQGTPVSQLLQEYAAYVPQS